MTNNKLSLFVGNISVNGTDIAARQVSLDRYEFGTMLNRYMFLNSADEAIGFLNAMHDVKKGTYQVLLNGLHLKFDRETLPFETVGEDRGYVNFDMLADPEWKAWLSEQGIEKLPGVSGWLSLNTDWGKVIPHEYAHPRTSLGMIEQYLPADYSKKTKEEQREIRKAIKATIHPDAFEKNDHFWKIVHKHKGVSLVQLLVAGKISVILDIQRGFDNQMPVIERKFKNLFGDVAIEDKARKGTIEKKNNQHYNDVGAYLVNHSETFKFEADLVTSDGVVFMHEDGAIENVPATSLIGKRITYVIGGQTRSGFEFMRTLENVKAAAVRAAQSNGWVITLWKPAA